MFSVDSRITQKGEELNKLFLFKVGQKARFRLPGIFWTLKDHGFSLV